MTPRVPSNVIVTRHPVFRAGPNPFQQHFNFNPGNITFIIDVNFLTRIFDGAAADFTAEINFSAAGIVAYLPPPPFAGKVNLST